MYTTRANQGRASDMQDLEFQAQPLEWVTLVVFVISEILKSKPISSFYHVFIHILIRKVKQKFVDLDFQAHAIKKEYVP